MKILTVNLPISFLQAIDKLVGEDKIFCSRSELIRVAVREFLIKELESVQSFSVLSSNPLVAMASIPEVQNNDFVRVPITMDPNTAAQTFKTYRIIKK